MANTDSDKSGIVTQFNQSVGLGEITDTNGRVWPFHCVAIEDGTRSIETGTSVVFTIRFHVAREEAFSIRKVSA